jgi:hypothetical protein
MVLCAQGKFENSISNGDTHDVVSWFLIFAEKDSTLYFGIGGNRPLFQGIVAHPLSLLTRESQHLFRHLHLSVRGLATGSAGCDVLAGHQHVAMGGGEFLGLRLTGLLNGIGSFVGRFRFDRFVAIPQDGCLGIEIDGGLAMVINLNPDAVVFRLFDFSKTHENVSVIGFQAFNLDIVLNIGRGVWSAFGPAQGSAVLSDSG